MYSPAFAPALGIMAERKWCTVIARAVFLRGNVGMFDLAQSNAAVLNALVGDSASSLVNVVAPDAGGINSGICCLFLSDAAIGQKVKALLRGRDKGLVIKSAGSVSRGDRLVASTAKNLSPDHAAGARIISRAVEPLTTPSVAALTDVDFDGINGLGCYVS